MTLSPASRDRLASLGIDVWVRRDRASLSSAEVARGRQSGEHPATHESRSSSTPRVRMASGDGDWLLVQDAPWDGRHDTLLGDIQAAIGSARCRFGQWAHSDSAGVAVDDLASRGVRHVLVFGEAPVGVNLPGVLLAPGLAELGGGAEARKRLWQLVSAEIGH